MVRSRSVVLWIVSAVGLGVGIAFLAQPPRPARVAAGASAPGAASGPVAPGARPSAEMVRQKLAEAVAALPSPVPPTDPRARDYRPEKLVPAAGLDIVYEAEPRHEPWATTVE